MSLAGFFLLTLPIRAQIDILHEFSGGTMDGSSPYGSLILSGSTLYGMTFQNAGTVFRLETNGSGFGVLRQFTGLPGDGSDPYDSLALSGTTLFGMTQHGGTYAYGTVFKMGTGGDGFSLLHSFAAGTADGAEPSGSPVLSGSTLYGMTPYYGAHTKGVIFKVDDDGSDFAVLHSFAGGSDDGSFPFGSLLLYGTTLYGMTSSGGDGDRGVIFKIETNGSGFAILHEFSDDAGDGRGPQGGLVLSGTTLFGMTATGGSSNFGTIFKIETNGTGFALLHSFAAGPADGAFPYGSLLLSGTTLYGMTRQGGGSDLGTLFRMQADDNGFTLLHSFAGGAADGASPYGSLILSGSTLFGMTNHGGGSNQGVIFSYALPPITVTAPNGGEHWTLGETRNITWTTIGYSGTLRLVLFKGGIRFGNIATGVDSAQGSFAWTAGQTIEATATEGSDYRFYLRSTDNTIVDPGDSRFSLIDEAQLRVTSPNGGESWVLGSTRNITWNANGFSGLVRLILFNKAAKIGQIATGIPGAQGSYLWTVGSYQGGTAPAGSLYSIRLQAADGSQDDFSDGPLTLTD